MYEQMSGEGGSVSEARLRLLDIAGEAPAVAVADEDVVPILHWVGLERAVEVPGHRLRTSRGNR